MRVVGLILSTCLVIGMSASYGWGQSNCVPEVSADFSEDNLSVTVNSSKDLSNVVINYCDDTTEKYDGLSGTSDSFSSSEKEIVGVWIKSGCNQSNDGPGYGEYVSNDYWDGTCLGDNDDNHNGGDSDNGDDDGGDNNNNGDGGDNGGNGGDNGDDNNGGGNNGNNGGGNDDNNGGHGDGSFNLDAVLIGESGLSSFDICPGEEVIINITISGDDATSSPWTITYTDGISNFELVTTTTSASISLIAEAIYSLVSIVDADGNSGDVRGSVTINHYEIPTAVMSGYDYVCSGESAKVFVNLTGTAPWEIVYTDGSDNYSFTSNYSFYGFYTGAGNYSLVSVSDANCEGTVSGSATIIENTISTATIAGSASICDGGTSPVTINLTGAAPWTIAYTDGDQTYYIHTSDESYSFYAEVGIYTLLSITDANCCEGVATGSVTIDEAEKPTATIAGDTSTCLGENATVTVTLTGVGPWDFGYTDGTQYYYTSSSVNEYSLELPVGSYSLTEVFDSNCEGFVSGNVTIEEATPPTATISGDMEVCEGTSTELTIDLTGTAPWNIVYTDGTSNYEVTSDVNKYSFEATPGTYTLSSISDTNCSGTVSGSATIGSTTAPTAFISGNYNICGEENVDITIAFTGSGPWNAVYSDGTDNNFNITSEEATYTIEAGTGEYTLVSVNDVNCNGTVSGTASVNIAEKPTASINGSGEVCAGTTTPLTILFTGKAPWSFIYTDGTNEYNLDSEISEFTFDATPGNYSLVSVSDANCTGTVSGTATITSIEQPTATISGDNSVCAGETVTVTINLTGTSPWDFSYSDGVNTFNETTSNQTFTFEANIGNYTLTSVSDANCSGTVSGEANISEVGVLSGIISVNDQYCAGDLITLESTLPQTGTNFTWTTSGIGTLFNANGGVATYESDENDNNITFTLVSSNACSQTTLTASTEIITVVADFEVIPEVANNEMTTGLDYTFIAPFGFDSYKWHFGEGLASTGSISSKSHTYAEAGKYTVTLGVEKGVCYDEIQKIYNVIDNTNLFVPNVINPTSSNEDNNKAKVYGENISSDKFTFEIYNRWGLLVYQTNNLTEAQTQGWNGNIKDEENENNVFTYIVRGSFIGGDTFEKTGTITLIK